jgi:hypothetical protein
LEPLALLEKKETKDHPERMGNPEPTSTAIRLDLMMQKTKTHKAFLLDMTMAALAQPESPATQHQ